MIVSGGGHSLENGTDARSSIIAKVDMVFIQLKLFGTKMISEMLNMYLYYFGSESVKQNLSEVDGFPHNELCLVIAILTSIPVF